MISRYCTCTSAIESRNTCVLHRTSVSPQEEILSLKAKLVEAETQIQGSRKISGLVAEENADLRTKLAEAQTDHAKARLEILDWKHKLEASEKEVERLKKVGSWHGSDDSDYKRGFDEGYSQADELSKDKDEELKLLTTKTLRLEGALRKYSDHESDCDHWVVVTGVEKPCTCGLSEALSTSPASSMEAVKEKFIKFVESQKDMPPDFVKILNEKFWELL